MSMRGDHELKRLVESALGAVCGVPRRGLWLGVDHVEPSGRPPDRLRVRATLHFTGDGSPFCCGEPECHLWPFEERLQAIEDRVRRAMGLRQRIEVDLVAIAAAYHDGVRFETGGCVLAADAPAGSQVVRKKPAAELPLS